MMKITHTFLNTALAAIIAMTTLPIFAQTSTITHHETLAA
jgi:hypothetical protein